MWCWQELADIYQQIIQQLQVVQKQVLDEEMIRWKRRQQLGGNGKPTLKTELDMLQQWWVLFFVVVVDGGGAHLGWS